MDLDEWELLPVDGFLDFSEGEKKVFSGKLASPSDHTSAFHMDYFRCPSPRSGTPNQLVPVSIPIQLDPPGRKSSEGRQMKEIKIPALITEKMVARPLPPPSPDDNMALGEAEQDVVSQVFFKKMTENEFVDMKMDSPRSNASRGIVPQVDAAAFHFDDQQGDDGLENSCSPRKHEMRDGMAVAKKESSDGGDAKEAAWEENRGGFNIWKWSLTGIGAICSFSVAAATICIITLGSRRNKQKNQQQNQKLRFQIYTDDKRIKQVVHHASKLNEAMSAVRGVPLTRAHITFGGYYDHGLGL